MFEQYFRAKPILLEVILALLAAMVALIVCRTGLIASLTYAFSLAPSTNDTPLELTFFALATSLLGGLALVTIGLLNQFGFRRGLPFLGIALIALGLAHLVSSRLFSFDILFTPTILAIFLAVLGVRLVNLWNLNSRLTDLLDYSAGRLNCSEADKASMRTKAGLKLLDTVISPQEIILFQRDRSGVLDTIARLRASGTGSLDSSRISSWRKGVSLCEQAMENDTLLTQKDKNEDGGINVAVPLRHAQQSVGALLIRVSKDLSSHERELLTAAASQLARNVQRQAASKAAASNSHLNFLSESEARRRLDVLGVVNGTLKEQRVGVNALADLQEAVAIAYLDGSLGFVNDPMLKLAHLTKDEAIDLTIFDLLNKLCSDASDEPVMAATQVLQTGEAHESEIRSGESAATFGLRISLIRDQMRNPVKAEPLCLAISISDVTRIKAYEQLKSDMISLMSHELRTPLTSINGFAELLTKDPELPEHAKEFVTIIASESQRLSRMINTFLSVTQLERKDRQDTLKIPLRLDDVVRETVSSLQPTAKKKRIRLIEQPHQRLPPVAADKSLITQAVKNLVSNAIKYSPEQTTVTVSTALEAEAVRVCVEDRGYGIPAEARDRVWEKFYRVTREGQAKDEESTGLGLSFVREVVEQHGGSVALETEEGRGSKFSFALPRM